tara:strand:- start:74 stop:514 length:441 start_codon:yes stop_codon:yes gene_type:complete
MSKDKVRLSPTDITSKWQKRTKAAVPDAIAGVDRVTESPAVGAIAKQDKMRQNLLRSIDDGVWAAGLGKVTLSEWKATTKAKIQQRLSGGVDAAQAKRGRFDTWLAGRLNGVLPTIAAMPDLTLDDSIARATALMQHMASERFKGS